MGTCVRDGGWVGAGSEQRVSTHVLPNIHSQQAFCLAAVVHKISVPSKGKFAGWLHSSPGKALDFILLSCLVACFN